MLLEIQSIVYNYTIVLNKNKKKKYLNIEQNEK